MTDDLYSTSDFPLACALLCKNFLLKEVSCANGGRNRKIFHFSAINIYDEPINEHVEQFYNGQMLVEPATFSSHQRSLKARISEEL